MSNDNKADKNNGLVKSKGWRMSKSEISTAIMAFSAVCGVFFTYANFHGRLAEVEQTIGTLPNISLNDLGENDCKWEPMVRAQNEVKQECSDGYYVKGVGVHYEDGRILSYPMRYRLYCCALKPSNE